MKMIALAACMVALTIAGVAQGADAPRPVKVLVVLRTLERSTHIAIAGLTETPDMRKPGYTDQFTATNSNKTLLLTQINRLNETFISTMQGFDRDDAMITALRLAFRERSPLFDVTFSADRDRYMNHGLSAKPTDAPHAEGYDFVLALYDDFTGLVTRDEYDYREGLLVPEFSETYALHDVGSGKALARDQFTSFGFARQAAEDAVKNRELFTAQWPFLCMDTATQIVDDLLRDDYLHLMAERVGRGAELPAVRDKLEKARKRLSWHLEPAPGWREARSSMYSRILYPRGDLSGQTWMSVDAEFLFPELGQGVSTVDEFVPIYDHLRRRRAPASGPLAIFGDISAPDYRTFRYADPGGVHKLVFFRKTGDSIMQVVTVTIEGQFDSLFPVLRPKIESMLAHSRVSLD